MFSGVNSTCKQCRQPCKQFKQIELVQCPKFLVVGQRKRRPSTHEEPDGYTRQNSENTKIVHGDVKKLKSQRRTSPKTAGLCPVCRKSKAISLHHIKPLLKGGQDIARNRVRLCPKCHDIVEDYTDRGKPYSSILIQLIRFNGDVECQEATLKNS